ncbi:methionyl-tRNA formyltransferase [Tundrisphaera sp. TA3]|uniref:methionyl-tRNA formyltransferase n=1 Tax=Tundrisphaera sp. TA3 TaxID=3435775 RepID=UPI003EBFA6DB
MPLPPRLIMLGTGDFALPTFEHLHDAGLDVAALITQPDRPQGRKQELIPSRIKQSALARSVRVEQPEDVNAPAALDLIRSIGPELLVTAAYGQILSADLLALPPLGGINLHGSILPAYRGAAPVARAIQKGEAETGVTVIRMTPRIDAGGMIAFARTPIAPDETSGELEARLAAIGAPLVAEAIAAILDGSARIIPQQKARVTKAPKLRKEDGRIDWTQPAQAVHNLIRAMQPWPIASTTWHRPDGPTRLIVHRSELAEGSGRPGQVLEAMGDRLVVAAGEGAVRLLKVQLEGRKPSPAAEFLHGHHPLGDFLGDASAERP